MKPLTVAELDELEMQLLGSKLRAVLVGTDTLRALHAMAWKSLRPQPLAKPRREPQRFDEDSREVKAARYLFAKIRTNNETAKEPNFQEWAREFDAIFRIDHRDPARVLSVINFAQADEFWYKNILSPKSLRKNFDKLTVKMTAKPAATRAAEPVPRKDL